MEDSRKARTARRKFSQMFLTQTKSLLCVRHLGLQKLKDVTPILEAFTTDDEQTNFTYKVIKNTETLPQ